jgi:hypothetical protein
MSKMAGSVGKDITERIFLPRFAAMCTDSLFHVRKVCATNFGEMCSVVGQENTEQHLVSYLHSRIIELIGADVATSVKEQSYIHS